MNENLPLVSFTKDDVERMKMNGTSGSTIVNKLIERLEKEKRLSSVQNHTNHQKHMRDDPSA